MSALRRCASNRLYSGAGCESHSRQKIVVPIPLRPGGSCRFETRAEFTAYQSERTFYEIRLSFYCVGYDFVRRVGTSRRPGLLAAASPAAADSAVWPGLLVHVSPRVDRRRGLPARPGRTGARPGYLPRELAAGSHPGRARQVPGNAERGPQDPATRLESWLGGQRSSPRSA